jgi:hypothetical protein
MSTLSSQQILEAYNREKFLKLLAVIGIDLLGVISYALPAIGELSDILIAPLSALLLFAVFKSKKAAIVGFTEEILPFTDIIPTGILCWISRYVIQGKATFEKFVQEKMEQNKILDKYQIQ